MATIAEVRIKAAGGAQAAKQLDQVGKSTERVGRAQTRLGQASASAGRQFSAQANGLGGLVQAYAGAAANVFAITAAFTALSRAAEFEQIIKGTEALASTIGANGQRIIESVQGITRSQLSLLETAQTVNIGLAAGFSTQQIEELSEVSLRASKALGRTLTDAFTRVSRGAAKLEPELLDELGIFTRIDPAVRAYADSVGRSVSSLTNFERRQAFANAVIEEGQRKFKDVDISSDSAAVSLEKLSATIIDLGLKFGAVLANSVAPLADFITGNLSNSLALFGILANQIGGLAITVLAAGIDKATASLTRLGTSAIVSLNSLSSAYTTASKAASDFASSKVRLSRFGTQEELTTKAAAKATLESIAAGRVHTKVQRAEATATLEAARAAELEFIARSKSTANKKIASAASLALQKQIALLAATEGSAIIGTSTLSVAIRGLTTAIGVLGTVLSRALGFVFTFITVASLAQLALDALGKAFGFQVSILESVINKIKEFIDSIYETDRAIEAVSKGIVSELESAARSAGAFGDQVDAAVKQGIDAFKDLITLVQANELSMAEIMRTDENFKTEMDVINNAIARLRKESEPAARVLENLVNKFVELGQGSVLLGQNIGRAIDEIARLSGVATRDVSKIVQGITDLNDVLEFSIENGNLFFNNTQISVFENGVFRLKEGFIEVSSVLTQGIDKVNDFKQGLADGSLNAERAAQAAGAIANVIAQAETESGELGIRLQIINAALIKATGEAKTRLENTKAEVTEAKDLLDASLDRLRIEGALADTQAGRLAALEKEFKLRRKIFGLSGEKLEESAIRGVGSPQGIAQNANQKEINSLRKLQTDLLKATTERQQFEELNVLALGKQKLITDRIAKSQAKLAELDEKGLINSQEARTEAQNLVNLQTDLSRVQDTITDASSKERARRDEINQIQEILTQKYQDYLSTQEKVTQQFEKQSQQLRDQAQQANIQATIKKLELEQKIADIQTKAALANLQRGKELNELFGTFTELNNIEFLKEKAVIEIAAAEADQKRADRRAEQNQKAAELNAESTLQNNKISLLATQSQLELARTQESIFKFFLDDLDKILATRAKEINPSANITSIKRENVGGQISNNDFLSNISQQFDLANKAVIEIYLAQVQTAKDAKEITEAEAAARVQAIRDAADQSIKLATIEASTRFKVFKSFADGTNETLAPALEGVFQSIADGTFTVRNLNDELNNFFRSLIENIRKKLLQETLIDPLTQGVTSSIKGSLFTQDGSSTQGGGILSAISGFFSGGKASGGLVHMAGGGQVRDRVPAMLEPGEFVIRRPMAKAIGGPVLNAMNATGTMPTGEVAVNITNTGTPQEATASPPRFDGEKMVVDIVMRDLRNNGPIRKSLRAGG